MTSPQHPTDTLLRSLDPADADVDARSTRAAADLERILATDPADNRGAPAPATTRRRRTRRMVLSAGLVTATAAAAVTVPGLTGQGDPAYATWTARPSTLSSAQLDRSVDQCRGWLDDVAPNPGEDLTTAIRTSDPVLSERRGRWGLVMLAGAGGFSAMCVTSDDDTGAFGSLSGEGMVPPEVGPRELSPTDLGWGGSREDALSIAAGYAGSDVTGVRMSTDDHGVVEATVNHGRFALWFPGRGISDDRVSEGVPVEVTYRDGSTATLRLSL